MGSGASKKSNEDAQAKSDEESDDFETYTQKKAEANGQPKLEQAGLLPKLEQPPSTTNFKKPTNGPRTIIGNNFLQSIQNYTAICKKFHTNVFETGKKCEMLTTSRLNRFRQ